MPEYDEQMREYMKSLAEGSRANMASYDKAVLTLSGGALALSMAFLKEIVKSPEAGLLPILFGAWICLAGSLLMTLMSMLAGYWSCRKALAEAYDGIRRSGSASRRYGIFTDILNIGAGLGCVGGVVLLAWFCMKSMK